jgi:predicted nucleic acid-binding protein
MYLLDSTAISERTGRLQNSGVVQWFDSTPAALQYTSVMVIGELRRGLVRSPRPGMEEWLAAVVAQLADHVLPVTPEVADRWGVITGTALRRGQPLPAIDSLIAATAIVNNLTVVTRNVRDFERCGAAVFSPWTGERR